MDPMIITMILGAVGHAKDKHPGGLGDHPYAVLAEEVGEAARAFLEGDLGQEQQELLDVIAVCVRRIEKIGELMEPVMQSRLRRVEERWKELEAREKELGL